MRLVVTGAHGFVGGSLGRLAHERRGSEVIGVGRRRDAPLNWPGEYVQAELEWSDLTAWLASVKPNVVFHAAGPASVGASFGDPQLDFRESVLTWANLLEAVRRSQAHPLVAFISSAAVYGDPASLPIHEEDPLRPISPYGFHKVAAEALGREYAELHGLNVLILRCFSLFGPSLRRLLVRELYEQLSSDDDTVWLQGTGREERDYLSIDDVEEAAYGLFQLGNAGLRVVNVARGESTTVHDLADELRRLVAPEKRIETRRETRQGDPVRWQADASRLRELLPAWEPRPLVAALADCVAAWNREDSAGTN